jgi:drug/metabolite transporter (DMT)-like permease
LGNIGFYRPRTVRRVFARLSFDRLQDVSIFERQSATKVANPVWCSSMENHVFVAVLVAALLHASWNSVVKLGLDRVSTVLLLALVQALIAAPILPFVAQPASEAWPWIIASAALHVGYKVFLVRAYAHADLSQAYPLARGTAPLIITLVSIVFLGVSLDAIALLAIFCISAGILIMAAHGSSAGRMRGKALFFAIGTAGFTASYTVVDGIGARLAGTASGFILWMVIGDAIGMVGYALWTRGTAAFPAMLPAWKTGIAAGAMSLGSYWIAVWAFTQAPIALVAALRESSILFAVLIAAFVLRERVSGWRWLSACAIVVGIALMKVQTGSRHSPGEHHLAGIVWETTPAGAALFSHRQ